MSEIINIPGSIAVKEYVSACNALIDLMCNVRDDITLSVMSRLWQRSTFLAIATCKERILQLEVAATSDAELARRISRTAWVLRSALNKVSIGIQSPDPILVHDASAEIIAIKDDLNYISATLDV